MPLLPVTSVARRRCLQLLAAGPVASISAGQHALAADTFEWRPWPAAKRVPAFDLPQPDGSRWRLAAQAGQVVLANFWASWCAPCRDEMPSLVRLAEKRAGDGLVVVGVNYRESAATATRFMNSLSLQLTTLLDADGALSAAYTPRIFPSTVVFDRRGQPTGTVVGEIDWGGDAAARILAPLWRPG